MDWGWGGSVIFSQHFPTLEKEYFYWFCIKILKSQELWAEVIVVLFIKTQNVQVIKKKQKTGSSVVGLACFSFPRQRCAQWGSALIFILWPVGRCGGSWWKAESLHLWWGHGLQWSLHWEVSALTGFCRYLTEWGTRILQALHCLHGHKHWRMGFCFGFCVLALFCFYAERLLRKALS